MIGHSHNFARRRKHQILFCARLYDVCLTVIIGFEFKLHLHIFIKILSMSNNAQRKLLQEMKNIQKSSIEGIETFPDEDDLFQWVAVIVGPLDTPW